jgi:hypothetical protein
MKRNEKFNTFSDDNHKRLPGFREIKASKWRIAILKPKLVQLEGIF